MTLYSYLSEKDVQQLDKMSDEEIRKHIKNLWKDLKDFPIPIEDTIRRSETIYETQTYLDLRIRLRTREEIENGKRHPNDKWLCFCY